MSRADRAVETATPVGRRERKKLQTKERIVECALGLFASRGYDSTTMEDIGECADVSRATVFNYFARKEDIVTEVIERRRARLAEFIAEATEHTSDTPDRLRRALSGLARLSTDDPATGRAIAHAWLRAGGPVLPGFSDTADLFADVVRSGQRHGDIPRGVDATHAGLVILDAYLGVLYRWVADEQGRFAFEANLMATLDLILGGIAPTPPAVRRKRR